ncbi:cell envelope integrity protein TolA [Gaoshiqia sediminis]|uniref:Cell envelope integrity protein TolA n=1 Tax=Gaoshiqia sediminis TaxID=2986998 RepID=A0AA42CB78_9BACT|nr:cell envelope integrity protein TolA [Gaoshiqia sediminis]MCW0484610.1 cell envelope integrity protein TolA [Gaoshiqia sediminis]
MSYFSDHKEGFWGTIVIHAIVLILLLLLGFFTPLPLPGEEGILVNFGDSEQGFGSEEPAPAPQKQSPPVVQEERKQTVPPPPPTEKTPAANQAKEEILTQDYEKTVALETAKKKEEEARKKQEELERQKKLEEQRKLNELERQRQAELEKQRLAEIARKKQEEEERLRREAEQKRIADINSRAANAFGSGGAGTNDSKSTSQGVTFPGGNQGSPTGAAGSSNDVAGGSGNGASGNGPSYSLKGRKYVWLPKPISTNNEYGIVVVAIIVDKNGKVISAEPGVKGTDNYNIELLNTAKQAALKSTFNAPSSAPPLQEGTITYRFVLD